MPYYVQKGKTTKVPNVVGLSLKEAHQLLLEAELEPKNAEYKSEKNSKIGTIILQNPLAYSEVKYGRGIYLTICGGEEFIEVPNLRGKSLRDAIFNLERFNLRIGDLIYEPSEELFENTIIRQQISAGTKVKSGVSIDVIVSQGRNVDKHIVPNVVQQTYAEAENKLIKDGFRIGKVTYQVNLDLLPNTVLEQFPHAGELVKLGQSIDLIIAQKSERKINIEN
jgi:serine/threonine-protein kinase